MPSSELINVREFRDKYTTFLRSQVNKGVFDGQERWSEPEKEEVANRCKITEDYSFSSSAFVNPTLFSMLRKHREFNEATEREIQRRKNEQREMFQRQQEEEIIQGMLKASEEYQRQQQQQQGQEHEQDATSHPGIVNAATTQVGTDKSVVDAIESDANNLLVVSMSETMATEESQRRMAVQDEDGYSEPAVSAVQEEMAIDTQAASDTGSQSVLATAATTDAEIKASAVVTATATSEIEADMPGLDQNTINDALARLSSAPLNSDNNIGIKPDVAQDSVPTSVAVETYQDDQMNVPAMMPSRSDVQIQMVDIPVTATGSSENLVQGISPEMVNSAMNSIGLKRSPGFVNSNGSNSNGNTEDQARDGNAGDRNNAMRVTKEDTQSPNIISDLEMQFRKVAEMLDNSTLASLREINRRMIPHKQRLELNFLTNRIRDSKPLDSEKVAKDEVILGVCFFNPRTPTSKMEEYLVLGSQPLTALRDAFYCITDFLITSRDQEQINTKERKVSSSYFYIEKAFYNDMRSPTATDYSRVIIEWANEGDRAERCPRLQGLQSRLMDGARFIDLSIRLRYPYVFVHQGNCEHIMMFTELRLVNPSDDQYVEQYPKQIFRTRQMRHKCRMCASYPAQYVTKNDFHSGMTPCYFCEKCYKPFHFDEDENILLEHEVYPYASANL